MSSSSIDVASDDAGDRLVVRLTDERQDTREDGGPIRSPTTVSGSGEAPRAPASPRSVCPPGADEPAPPSVPRALRAGRVPRIPRSHHHLAATSAPSRRFVIGHAASFLPLRARAVSGEAMSRSRSNSEQPCLPCPRKAQFQDRNEPSTCRSMFRPSNPSIGAYSSKRRIAAPAMIGAQPSRVRSVGLSPSGPSSIARTASRSAA